MSIYDYINSTDSRALEIFPSSVSYSIFLFKDLKFLSYKPFSCFIAVTLKIFYIIRQFQMCCFPDFFLSLFVICISDNYWYFLVNLMPSTFLKMFINCKSSLVEILGSIMCTIISSDIKDTFTSFFPCRSSLISLSFLIALA